ncbi:sigma-54-dependent Fis family transcriptional regulator [Enterobacter sp. CC120223-11]|uniref:sigma-54-dependent Fis family transcriptional regulator n=1 Tax=Enterobacter sp. CC120223-11 TaxID=1378073 RepID=UPI000BC9CE22|nr:sigma-54-dependent Fis family transcriptional regulator [Enterobacter sp. CC120223-11]SNY61762.1 Transcriptional regulator of acetoin/glycerol metabolism [Enterobacter sp. CC120223-11]
MQGKSTDSVGQAHSTPLLRESWFRSELYGLERSAEDFPLLGQGELADRLASHSGLQRYAFPMANHLAESLTETQSVVVLTDATGVVLQTIGNMSAMEKAQRFALSPGTLWSENGRGTNAIGTALAIDDSCEIDGEQHFLTSNQNLYCAAIPLQTPDGQVAGVLDISGPAHFSHTHTLAWVKSAARQIEYLWVKQSLHPQQWLMSLHPDPQKLDSVEEMLLVFSDNVLTTANRLALRKLGIDAERLGSITFGQLFPQLKQTPCAVPMPAIHSAETYYYRLRAPAQTLVSVPPKPAVAWPFSLKQNGEKMVRLLNAGVSLCVQGETGSGKEFVSQTLYQRSRWREGKFIAINCAAIPESLIESELFGYQPGAFTGANKNGYIGKIREADGGVLFLDEIGDMPLALQTRLLRVLQDKVVAPLGSSRSWPVNFAVICATHRNLAQLVANGEFREDLLYRLQEFTLTIPPLREWPELVAFIEQQWLELGGQARRITLSPPLLETLAHFGWPGNVRQLRSLMKVLLALAEDGETLGIDALPVEYRQEIPEPAENLKQHDTALIASTLARFNGNISKAAQALGVARSTLYRRAARVRDEN